MLEKEIAQKLAHLTVLVNNHNQKEGSILRIFHELFIMTHEGRDLPPNTLDWLNETASLFLSPDLLGLLVKHRLDVYGFTFAGLHFTEVDDVIDDLSNKNGEILKGIRSFPPGALIKLKRELLMKRPLEQSSRTYENYASETKALESKHHDQFEVKSKFLTFTAKGALDERKRIDKTIGELSLKIAIQLARMDELHKTKQMIENCSDLINADKNFKYTTILSRGQVKTEITDGKDSINCSKCSTTCYVPCKLAITADKLKCDAMDKDGLCRYCPLRCKWDLHVKQNFRWVYQGVSETKTYAAILERYEEVVQRTLSTEGVAELLGAEFEQIKYDLKSDFITITACLQSLDRITLSAITTTDYIEWMIQEQEKEQIPGFKERIKNLNSILVETGVVHGIFPEDEIVSGQSCSQLTDTSQAQV